ncbi:TRIO and F-actin-binding protein isoform X2 [Sarcophilus harrisii]|uniref:TRIO and F-actin-binding protein isoform X2 n=1 Tax=Sarcophilus harrisii TaxID=9305 RepID=UPI001301CC27|nr:TRIO and F-actin-binding protein isoform X2 [Sarcophilus harrisii]
MMEKVTDNISRKHSEASVFAESHCQNCSEVQEAHYDPGTQQETGTPLGAEVPYCDLKRGPQHPKDTLCILSPSCELVVATALGHKPESLGVPVEWPSAESPVTQPGCQEIGSGVPYLESLTCTQLRNSSEASQAGKVAASTSPDCSPGSHCPDEISTPDAVDLDAADWLNKPRDSERLIMMFSRHQERAQADSPRKAPSSISRASASGDTPGLRREDSSHGNQSSRESRVKSCGESGYFSLERNKLDSAQTSQSLQSGFRSISRNPGPAKSVYHDTPQTSSSQRSTQRDTTRSSSPHRSAQRDTTRSSSPHRSAQRDTTRSSSPHRSSQWDTTRSSSPHRSTQRDTTRSSSPNRSAQRDTTRSSSPHQSTQRDAPRSSSPHRSTQRDTTRSSSPHRSAQRDTTRSSSPHQSTQRDAPRSSSPHRSTQRDTTRSSSPHRSTQRDTTRSSSPHQSSQQDATRSLSPHRSALRDTTRSSSPHRSTQRDAPRSSSPHRSTQRDAPRSSSPHRSTQRDVPRSSSPHRSTQRDVTIASSPHQATQRDTTRASSPHGSSTQRDTTQCSSTQRDKPRPSSTLRDNPRASSPTQPTPKDNPRASSSQRDNPRASTRDNPGTFSSARSIQRDNLQASSGQRDNPRTSSTRDNPWSSSPARTISKDNPRASSTQRDNPRSSSIQRDNPGSSSPMRSSQRSNPRTSSSHRTNRDIPWASFPLRPIQSDGPRASSPARSKQSEVPWASFPLRPVQGDSSRTSSPTRSFQLSSKTSQCDTLTRGSSCQSGPRSSTPPLSSTRTASQTSSLSRSTSLDSPNPPSIVCIGHRDAPRASSPPRVSQHDPFSFFPDPPDDESQFPHHEPPYIPPAVCIGHRDAPRASSPPRHSQHDPFPFLPNTSDTAESQFPQHDPPQMPPPVCIGHRDAPRASSPPRQSQQEPSLLYQDVPGASSESLSPSTGSVHEPPHMPPPVCIGHRDAPPFSSPPRHTQHDPSLLYQDPPGASSESLALSMDSQHEAPQIPTPVCIGHRDAPLFTSPPRQAHNDPSLLNQTPPGASSESLTPSVDSLHDSLQPTLHVCIGHRDAPRASSPPRHWDPPGAARYSSPQPGPSGSKGAGNGEGRHNLEREEYTVLADLPPPKRLNQKEAVGKPNGSASNRTRSPGRTEVERIFGYERRKSDALETYQALEAGRSPRGGGRAAGQLQRRQSSPALCREVTKKPPQTPEQTRKREPPHSKSPERHPEGDRRSKAGSAPPKNLVRLPERECRARGQLVHSKSLDIPPENERPGQRQPLGLRHLGKSMEEEWGPAEEACVPRSPSRHPDRDRARAERGLERNFRGQEGHFCTRPLDMYPDSQWRGPTKEILGCWRALAEQVCCRRLERLRQSGQLGDWEELAQPGRAVWDCNGLGELGPPPVPDRPAKVSWGGLGELPGSRRLERADEIDWAGLADLDLLHRPERPSDVDWRDLGELPHPRSPERPVGTDWGSLGELLGPRSPDSYREMDWGGRGEPMLTEGCWLENGGARPPRVPKEAPEREWQSAPEPAGLVIHDRQAEVNGYSPGERLLSPIPSVEENGADSGQPSGSAPWPKSRAESLPRAAEPAALQEDQDKMANELPPGPRPSEEPEAESSVLPKPGPPGAATGQKTPLETPLETEQETADTPDLLNFKKGWMSILDEPGEWKKHWFVLTDSSLKYYRDSNAEEADELDGEIDLRSCTDVTEFAVQRNYGFQIHTKDAVFTLSAMTSGIRRNWIEALRKTVRPANAPDVTKLSDSNKENTIHGYSSHKGSLKSEEQRPASEVIGRGPNRKADGQRQAFDYVELSPLSLGTPQRRGGSVRGSDRGAKQDELERDLAQRSEERRKWFEATESRAGEPGAGEGPRKVLGGPLTEDQQSRLSDEIEKKWLELEKLPLRENKRVPLMALQSKGEQKGPSGDSTEALEKEVQSLRAQLESCRLRGDSSRDTPKPHEDGHIPRGYISQEACERSLAEMESSHQQVMEELQRHHQRELERLQQEKEWLLAEETAATASAIEAMKKAFKEELNKELGKTRSLQQGPESLRKQHQSDMDSLKRELQVLSEQYSQKCLEIGDLTRQAEERERILRHCQQEGKGLLRQNQELHSRLSEEIGRLRNFIASQASSDGLGRNNERSSCELEVLLRVKENELQYLKKEVQCLRDELQMIQKDKRFTSGKYQDVYVELNHIKSRSEREIEQLKEHLRLAMAALREKESMQNNLDN